MMKGRGECCSIVLILLLIGPVLSSAKPGAGSTGAGWTVLGNGDNQQYFSPLAGINDRNVAALGLAWYADIPSQDGLVGNPLVADGVVYQSGAFSRVYANDVRTGELLWRFDPQINLEGASLAAFWSARYNRGVALWEDKVIVGTGDCRLVAIDRKTGKKIWDAVSCDRKALFGITAAPRVGGGKVFIGNNCIDSGVGRGYVDAFDVQTGVHKWRFYTVPGAPPENGYGDKTMEMAAKTWGSGEWWKKATGCGSAWDAITFDPKTNLLYFGVDGPTPWNPTDRAADAGDELFTNSIVAVNAETGEYVWHYKTTPHDAWNFDATMHIMVADLPIKGAPRHVVMTAPKNGFFYVLDAMTGKFLSANNYTPVNWASHIDPKTGRPVPIPDANWWEHPDTRTIASPGPTGAHNWQAMAFNPATRLVYIPAMITPTAITMNPQAAVGGASFDPYYGLGDDPRWKAFGELVAWDPVTQKARWRAPHKLPMNGGLMSTAGNLVFQGTADGNFEAYRADSGGKVWSMNLGESIMGAATAVSVDGEEVILVPAGNSASVVLGTYMARLSSTPETRGPSRLLAFKLGGNVKLPATKPITVGMPPRPKQPAELARRGAVLFEQSFCVDCHGYGAEAAGGSIPDLRNASAQTHDSFEAIVIGGLRKSKGMPQFPDLPLADVQAIHAYLINQAWSAFEAQQAKPLHASDK
jgi:PQQ-dependent dehydrogenase (methanol/ethanol family)